MGGLLGGALGGMLFGSMFGASGSGMGILPLIILGVVGYFLYKRFVNRPELLSFLGLSAATVLHVPGERKLLWRQLCSASALPCRRLPDP